MLDTFLNSLRDTAIGRAITAERAAAAHHARQELLDELARLEANRTRSTAEHDRAIAPLQKAERDAAAKHEAARDKLRAAERARAAAIHGAQSRVTAIQNELRRTADPRIDEALRALNARYESGRHTLCRGSEVVTAERWESGKRVVVTIGNERARARLLAAVRDARAALELLRYTSSDDVESAIAVVLAPVNAAWAAIDELDPMPVGA